MQRALIVEDQTTLRELLVELLTGMRYEVAAAASAGEARAALAGERFRIVLLDLVLPDAHGLELLELLRAHPGRPRVLVLTAHARAAVVRDALERGAHAVLSKGAPLRELRTAIEQVAQGGSYRCAETRRLLAEAQGQPAVGEELTARQRQILRAVASGMSSKEIASALSLSEKTVTNHRARIMERLGVHDVASLTRFAVSLGLVDPTP